MPVFVGPGALSGSGFEASNNKVGIPTATSDPSPANLGDMYIHTVGSGTTLMLYNGTQFKEVTNPSMQATGGTKAAVGNKTIHTFSGPGNFVVTTGGPVNYLLVGGGGGAGFDVGGAGGAGGLHYKENVTLPATTYPVTIGGGGAPGSGQNDRGDNGTDSTFNGLTAGGGGGGGSYQDAGPGSNGNSGGGSGGGGGEKADPGGTSPGTGGHPGGTDIVSPSSGWGGDGGESNPNPWSAGAGGGSGGDATNPPGPNTIHDADNHTTYTISGSSANYAGGGYGNSDGGTIYQTGKNKSDITIGVYGFGANATGAPNTNPYPGNAGVLIISYDT